MHTRTADEKISPTAWALKHLGPAKWGSEDTRHHWRKLKRNRGQKPRTRRTRG